MSTLLVMVIPMATAHATMAALRFFLILTSELFGAQAPSALHTSFVLEGQTCTSRSLNDRPLSGRAQGAWNVSHVGLTTRIIVIHSTDEQNARSIDNRAIHTFIGAKGDNAAHEIGDIIRDPIISSAERQLSPH